MHRVTVSLAWFDADACRLLRCPREPCSWVALKGVDVHAGHKRDARVKQVLHDDIAHVNGCVDAYPPHFFHGGHVQIAWYGLRGSNRQQALIAAVDRNGGRENAHGANDFLLGELGSAAAAIAVHGDDLGPVWPHVCHFDGQRALRGAGGAMEVARLKAACVGGGVSINHDLRLLSGFNG